MFSGEFWESPNYFSFSTRGCGGSGEGAQFAVASCLWGCLSTELRGNVKGKRGENSEKLLA